MSDPGEKNKIVQLQKRTMTADGDEVYYTDEIKTVYAKVEPISNREALFAGALSMPDTLRVTIWYRQLNPEEYRLVYGGNIYNIEDAVDVKGLHEDMQITCTKEPDAVPAIERTE